MRPPFPILTPQEISAPVLKACHAILADSKPTHVPVHLEPYSRPDECHKTAAEKVRRDGGRVQCGWAIWEIPDWEIQLEFHSVWQSPQKILVDVSPPSHGGPVVLFLADPTLVYTGINIATLHYPYNDSAFCQEYVEVVDQINRLLLPPGLPPIPAKEVSQIEMDVLNAKRRLIFAKAQDM